MRTCGRCGASLPDEAAYCMQCGAPAATAAPGSIESSDFIQPALVGGAALGFLSSIPIISAGNCLCCMWVVGGGALAAWLLDRQRRPESSPLTVGDGAFVGVLGGLFGAVVATLLSIPLRLMSGAALEAQRQAIEEMLAEYPEVEGAIGELLLEMASSELSLLALLVTFLMNVVMFALFAMVGGILFVAMFQRKATGPGAGPAPLG